MILPHSTSPALTLTILFKEYASFFSLNLYPLHMLMQKRCTAASLEKYVFIPLEFHRVHYSRRQVSSHWCRCSTATPQYAPHCAFCRRLIRGHDHRRQRPFRRLSHPFFSDLTCPVSHTVRLIFRNLLPGFTTLRLLRVVGT